MRRQLQQEKERQQATFLQNFQYQQQQQYQQQYAYQQQYPSMPVAGYEYAQHQQIPYMVGAQPYAAYDYSQYTQYAYAQQQIPLMQPPPPPPPQYPPNDTAHLGVLEMQTSSVVPQIAEGPEGVDDPSLSSLTAPKEKRSNTLAQHGNTTTFNINSLLHRNITESDYFHNLYQLSSYHEVVAEVQSRVTHVEPWQTGTSRIPSTAFCLLLKFLLMKLTVNQMQGLLSPSQSNTNASPHTRAIGLLYLRYSCPPAELYEWYEPYLEDDEEFSPSSDGAVVTIGAFAHRLLTDMQFYGTQLPRIPLLTERAIKVKLLLLVERQKRRKQNLRVFHNGGFAVGTKVKAYYAEDKEPKLYDATIDSLEEQHGELPPLFWVTFSEYGNQECVDLGDLVAVGDETTGHSRSASVQDDRHGRRTESDRDRNRSRSRSRDRGANGLDGSLMDKVIQSSRDASAADGKHYAKKVGTYRGALSMKLDRYTARPRSRSRSPPPQTTDRSARHDANDDKNSICMTNPTEVSTARLLELQKLKERYGDASKSK